MAYSSPLKHDYSPWTFWASATEEERRDQHQHQGSLASHPGVVIGERVFLSPHAMIDPGTFSIGSDSYVAAHAYIDGNVELGSNTTINPFTVVRGKVTIGDAVRIGAHTSIIAFNHGMDPDELVYKQKHTSLGIRIGDDVWVGSNVVVLDGVTIGSHSVLAAGAVVTKDVPDWSIVGGSPARHIRDRRTVGPVKAVHTDAVTAGPGAVDSLPLQLHEFADAAREDAAGLIGRSWVPSDSGGRYVDQPGAVATVRAHCDAVEIADLLMGSVPEQLSRAEHIDRLRALQDPVTGLCPELDAADSSENVRLEFGTGAATYHVLSVGYALDLLGSAFQHPVNAVTEMDPASIVAALEQQPWQTSHWEAGAWVDAWGTASHWNISRHGQNATAAHTVFGWLLANSKATTGAWGDPEESTLLEVVNGYYRLTRGTFAQFGLPVPHPEQLVNTVLGHGGDPRFFADGKQNACNVLDVAHPLWLARKQTNHREAEVQQWARQQLHVALSHWTPGAGMAFSFSGDDRPECQPGLQGTEMWLAIVWYLADLLDESEHLGYKPRGVHRPGPALSLARLP